MNEITYRFFESHQITAPLTAQVKSLLQQLGTFNTTTTKKHLVAAALSSRILAAFNHTTVVGIACLIPIYTLTRRCGIIEHVVVDEKMRRKGVGTRMMQEIFDEARKMGLSRLDLTCGEEKSEAQKMYLKLGFETRTTCNFRRDL